jgi:hypothetical protein
VKSIWRPIAGQFRVALARQDGHRHNSMVGRRFHRELRQLKAVAATILGRSL